MLLVLHHRRSVRVERLDRLQSPGLALLAFFLGPGDRLPVGRQYQFRAGIRHFDAVAAGRVDGEEERLLYRVHVRAGLDEDAVLEEDVGGEQDLLARVERVGDVMEAAGHAGVIARIGEVVGLVGGGQPDAGFRAVIEHDALGQAEAEIILEELAAGRDVGGQPVPVVETADVAAASREALRLVLQRGLQRRRRLVPFSVVIEFDDVAVRVLADEGLAVAEIAVGPADVEAGTFQRRGAALARLRRAAAIGDVLHAVRVGGRELERVALVVVIGAQVDAVAFFAGNGHAHDVDEEAHALVEGRGQELEMAEMGDVEDGYFGQGRAGHGALFSVCARARLAGPAGGGARGRVRKSAGRVNRAANPRDQYVYRKRAPRRRRKP